MTFLNSLMFGSILGLFSFVANWVSAVGLRPKLEGNYWYPRGSNAQEKILRRGARAISSGNWSQALPYVLPGLVIGLICVVLYWIISRDIKGVVSGGIGFLLGFAFSSLLDYPAGLRISLRKYRKEIAQAGAKMLARLDDIQLAGTLFSNAAKQADSNLRLAAVTGFRELGEIQHLDTLEMLCNDADFEVKENSLEAIQAIQKLVAAKPLSVLHLSAKVNDLWALNYKLKQLRNKSSDENSREIYEENQSGILEILNSQRILRRSFPHLYCQQCYASAERQTAWDWEWVRCKSCQDAVNLVAGVERVTGQIGGSTAWNLSEGHLQVQLWDAAVQSARSGRISTLEIIGGQNIDYDWAVSAVVEKLHNENPDYGKTIRVLLVGEPALAANTVKLLRDLDPQFVDEK